MDGKLDPHTWPEILSAEFAGLLDQIASYLPRLAIAAAVIFIGWLTAKLVRAISIRLFLGLDSIWHRFIHRKGLAQQIKPHFPPARIAAEILFWFVMLFFVAGAASVLGLGTFVTWLSQIAAYLPVFLTGMLIILAGVIISALVRDLTTSAAQSTGLPRPEMLGRLTQSIVMLVAVVIGADQIGIDISFLSIIIGVGFAGMLGALALAFGTGARSYIANILSGRRLQQTIPVGARIRIKDIEGTVTEITATTVMVDTNAGKVAIPAKVFDDEILILLESGLQHERT